MTGAARENGGTRAAGAEMDSRFRGNDNIGVIPGEHERDPGSKSGQ